jgi:hypothetical protein
MDVEQFLDGVIRFSNFVTSRLLVSGVVFYVLSGFMDLGSASAGFLPDVGLVNQVVENYQSIFDMLGVSEFALVLILFIFVTTIHLIYIVFEKVGDFLPPAIVPVEGWGAIGDVTVRAFETLRAARGEEHSEDENQRLYEFTKKLKQIERDFDAEYEQKLRSHYATFRIAKTFVLFSILSWLFARSPADYVGNVRFLLVILGLSVLVAFLAAVTIFKGNRTRLEELRKAVIQEIQEFARIWTSEAHQRQVEADTAAYRQLSPATLTVVVPVYGTLDVFLRDLRRWQERRLTRKQRGIVQ